MGLLDSIIPPEIKRLQALLTKENLIYLDKVLSMLLDPAHPSFAGFWQSFKQSSDDGEAAYRQSYIGLKELRSILRDYRAKGGR